MKIDKLPKYRLIDGSAVCMLNFVYNFSLYIVLVLAKKLSVRHCWFNFQTLCAS